MSAGTTSPFDRPQLGDWLKNRLGRVRRSGVLPDGPDSPSVAGPSGPNPLVPRAFRHAGAALLSHSWTYRAVRRHHRPARGQGGRDGTGGHQRAQRFGVPAQLQGWQVPGRYTAMGIPPEQDELGTWRLVQDPEQVKVIREVVERVLAGEPLRAVAHDLTARGIPTPRDRFAQDQGREVKGYEWHSAGLKRSDEPDAARVRGGQGAADDAQGRVLADSKGKKCFGPETVVRNDDGSPVVRAEPILTREVFDRSGGRAGRPGEPQGTDEAQQRATAPDRPLRGLRPTGLPAQGGPWPQATVSVCLGSVQRASQCGQQVDPAGLRRRDGREHPARACSGSRNA